MAVHTIKGFRDNKEKSNMISLANEHGQKVKDVAVLNYQVT